MSLSSLFRKSHIALGPGWDAITNTAVTKLHSILF
jgi:hypothetical protein